ncbi:MAG TPA: ATP synthase delta/epsilon chain alpha-helix domain-containing protein, partial [bacterium]|nr:ATP synthase delta/epsilon chain alpha-helix domain-containing protein [bacterium]
FVQIDQHQVVVLAETAEAAEAIDIARAKAAAGTKQQALSQGKMSEEQITQMQASLMKELIRLKVAEKVRKG